MTIDPSALIARRRAAQDERERLAADRWRRFQAASVRRHGAKARRRQPAGLAALLARGKSPGRMLLLLASGVWDNRLDRSLGSMDGPTASLGDYVRAGPDPTAQPRALFDQSWYLQTAPALAGSRWAPLAHYLAIGDSHNLSPHPLFDAAAYRGRQGARMAAARMTALEHFLFDGAGQGVNPHPLFDLAYYVGQCEAVAQSGENPLIHYLRAGWREGLEPHPLFAGGWYREANPDVAGQDIAPLLHYVTTGAAEGRNPHPLFDTATYLKQARARRRGGDPLSDYILGGAREQKRPSAVFRPAFYLEQVADDPTARLNPLQHYLTVGTHAGLWPAPDFDETAYFVANPEAAESPLSALEHWTRHATLRPANAAPVGQSLSAEALFQALRGAVAESPQIEDNGYAALRRPRASGGTTNATVVALRQSRAPDWLAVARALPNYRGHAQPKLPADGFTDPADPQVLLRDVALAQRYGVSAFCHQIADSGDLAAITASAFPFCIAWTGPTGAADTAPIVQALTAPQALRIDGRPVLVLTADADPAAWRAAATNGLFLIQHGGRDAVADFDAWLAPAPAARTPEGLPGSLINPDFRGLIHDYQALVAEHLGAGFAPWPQIPTVFVGRDTTPAFQDGPVVWQGATPGGLQAWLQAARDAVRDRAPDQRLVFIDSWNDWTNGSALAPDLRFGHGWLEAVANAADADLLVP